MPLGVLHTPLGAPWDSSCIYPFIGCQAPSSLQTVNKVQFLPVSCTPDIGEKQLVTSHGAQYWSLELVEKEGSLPNMEPCSQADKLLVRVSRALVGGRGLKDSALS